jgi:hypothetical protein
MATRNHSRGTRLSGREGGNRPRTHPPQSLKRPTVPQLRETAATVRSELTDVRLRLAVAMSAAYLVSAALKGQEADSDSDSARVLQRCVGDTLDRQIERIDRLLTQLKNPHAEAGSKREGRT